MLRLKNIEKKGNIITCDIIPEDSKESGRMEYDIAKKDVVLFELPNGYEYCSCDDIHAKKFFDNVNLNDIPTEQLLMWY